MLNCRQLSSTCKERGEKGERGRKGRAGGGEVYFDGEAS